MMKRVFSWLLVILWMGLIFYLSHQPATQSSHLSTGITEKILAVIDRMTSKLTIDVEAFHHLIRKGAHFFAYLVLGVLVTHALKSNPMTGVKSFLIALAICMLYATSDEVHQLFVPGRAGQVKDVMIDSVGATVGISGYLAFRKLMISLKFPRRSRLRR